MAYYPKYNKNKNKPKALAGAQLAALGIKALPFIGQTIKGIFDSFSSDQYW